MSFYVKLRRYNILAMIVNDADPWCGLGWRVVVVFVGGGWGGGGLGGGVNGHLMSKGSCGGACKN